MSDNKKNQNKKDNVKSNNDQLGENKTGYFEDKANKKSPDWDSERENSKG